MVSVQAKHNTVAVKFDLEFQLVPLHLIAAYRAGHAAALPAESAVGLSDGQHPAPNRLAGLLAEDRFIGHRADSKPSPDRAPEPCDFRKIHKPKALHVNSTRDGWRPLAVVDGAGHRRRARGAERLNAPEPERHLALVLARVVARDPPVSPHSSQ